MFEFVDDLENRVSALQQKYNNTISEFQSLLQSYQQLKEEQSKLLERNQIAYTKLAKLLENLPVEIADSITSKNDNDN